MTKSETISNLKADLDGDTAIGNIIPLRSVLEAAVEHLEEEPDWITHKVDLQNCTEEYRKAYYDGWNNCNQQHSHLPTIKGWVARDRSYNLSLYTYMPIRLLSNNEWSLPLDYEGDEIEIPIPDNLFPTLQWEDEPIEVELQIKPLNYANL